MSRPKRWVRASARDGLVEITLSSWRWFHDLVNQELLVGARLLFRGQASSRWRLESSLDRALKRIPSLKRAAARANHLDNFRLATRGRRGTNPPLLGNDESAWWALGQHHGLVTPLLDFTESPFVALYFAYLEVNTDTQDHRVVWCVQEDALPIVAEKTHQLIAAYRPQSDENSRLVSQRGLFITCPEGQALDAAIRSAFEGDNRTAALVRIRLPNQGRGQCLSALNRMNINHLSLFPDLLGAAVHSNNQLRLGY